MSNLLACANCPATARDTSKERNRFKLRHPKLCIEHQNKKSETAVFNQQLAEGTRSVEDGE